MELLVGPPGVVPWELGEGYASGSESMIISSCLLFFARYPGIMFKSRKECLGRKPLIVVQMKDVQKQVVIFKLVQNSKQTIVKAKVGMGQKGYGKQEWLGV